MTGLLISIFLLAAPAASAADAVAASTQAAAGPAELAAAQAPLLESASLPARLAAINALAALRESGADQLLYDRFPAETYPYARIQMTEAFAALRSTTAQAGLLLALGDDNPSVRQAAVIALASFEDEAAVVPALERLAAAESDARVLLAAARALGSFKGDRAADAADYLLSSGAQPELRLLAVEALDRMGTPRAAAALERAAADADPEVKKAAAAGAARLKRGKGKK